MAKIKNISAREILNAKGDPTIECSVTLSDGTIGIASCPSGTSTGTHEAVELHDEDKTRFKGLGVLKAINNIEKIIAPQLIDRDATNQERIDNDIIVLDGTANKSHLGANATLSVSIAVAKTAAISAKKPLYKYLSEVYNQKIKQFHMPIPLFNIINGGKHGSGSLDFQEFFIIPAKGKSYTHSLYLGVDIYQNLKKLLTLNHYSTLVGYEGGFEPSLQGNINALILLTETIETTKYQLGSDVFLGIDAAANSFYYDQSYHLKDKKTPLSAKELIAYYHELIKEFPLLYLEDLLAEDDWDGWCAAERTLDHVLIVADDLIATNPQRLQTAIDKKAATGVIIKPNQIGTITETIAVVEQAQQAGFTVIVSHRSGETNDDFIADFAVAVGADYIKFGAPARGERVAKYNRLLQIESFIQN